MHSTLFFQLISIVAALPVTQRYVSGYVAPVISRQELQVPYAFSPPNYSAYALRPPSSSSRSSIASSARSSYTSLNPPVSSHPTYLSDKRVASMNNDELRAALEQLKSRRNPYSAIPSTHGLRVANSDIMN